MRLRLLTVRKLTPAIAASNPAIMSHSTFAPVVASVGVVDAAGAADGVLSLNALD